MLHKLKPVADSIPLDIPEATAIDHLAQYVDPVAPGWGTNEDIEKMIRRGPLGFSALVDFLGYFTETRGVDEALFEGKLWSLLECATKLMLVTLSCCTIDTNLSTHN